MVSPIINMPNTVKHSGISGIPTQLLVLHSGESPLRGGYAQSLTNWANTPLAQGGPVASWHWFVDPIAIVSMVPPQYAAWHASEANPMSEGFEQAGYARFSRAEWTTAEGLKQLDNLAWLMAQRAKVNGIPMKWLTTDQVNAITSGRDRKTKGFCTHAQIDPDTRYDPGAGYPYDLLTAKINSYLNPKPTQKEIDMATLAEIRTAILQLGWAYKNKDFDNRDAYRLLREIPLDVWSRTINRGGKKIAAIQELADCKTLALENKAAIAELDKKLDDVLSRLQHCHKPPTE